jgi:hypothetical protein
MNFTNVTGLDDLLPFAGQKRPQETQPPDFGPGI